MWDDPDGALVGPHHLHLAILAVRVFQGTTTICSNQLITT
jgi:hypothetical protein